MLFYHKEKLHFEKHFLTPYSIITARNILIWKNFAVEVFRLITK